MPYSFTPKNDDVSLHFEVRGSKMRLKLCSGRLQKNASILNPFWDALFTDLDGFGSPNGSPKWVPKKITLKCFRHFLRKHGV